MTGGVSFGRKMGLDRPAGGREDAWPMAVAVFPDSCVAPAGWHSRLFRAYILWFIATLSTRAEKLVKNCFIFLKKGIDFIENIAIIG